ncbi:MAG: hypothetical protein WA775_07910 [Psychroserpens sp.]|uniref:hypothetical protein n=1 Tax=Psychroserpens sp. TaxID=2020870 RepID=UPI003C73631C
MNTITKIVVLASLCFIVSNSNAQTTESDSIQNVKVDQRVSTLEQEKIKIESLERELLKQKVSLINDQLDREEITIEEAQTLKKEAAKRSALNIENRISIVDQKIALLTRNGYDNYQYINDAVNDSNTNKITVNIGSKGVVFDLNDKPQKPPKYDIRTTNKLLFAIGFNNAIGDEQSLDDSPYELAGSGFVELGWLWSTRILKESNFFRVNYGFSFQWNKLNIKDNLYVVQNGDETTLQEFPLNLKKSQFRTTNLVFPVHFEMGPSRKRDYENRLRYTTDDHFRVGLGGYGGFRIAAQHKLKYEEDGDRVKQKIRKNYNTSTFVYGLSGYVGIGDVSLYAKYDLSPLFKDQEFDQHNVSLGLRFDLD